MVNCFSKHVFELILKNMKNIQIEQNGKEFKKLDNLGNKYRERLTLVDCDFSDVQINGIDIDLYKIFLKILFIKKLILIKLVF